MVQADLIECKKRGAKECHGIHISQKHINHLKKQIKQTFILHKCDLNKSFPNFSNKFDLIIAHDVIYYLEPKNLLSLFQNLNKILNKNGLIIFQYLQAEYKQVKKDNFSFSLNNYKRINQYHNKNNPIRFIKDKEINKIIKDYDVIRSFFTSKNFFLNDNNFIGINRYFIISLK